MTRRQRRKKRQRKQALAAFRDRQRDAARSQGDAFRTLSLRLDAGGRPASLDEDARAVDIVAATDAPVPMLDWETGRMVDEILLMSGCQIPANGQVPLLDTHSRYDTSTVIGSCRGLSVDGSQLLARAVFTSRAEGEGPFTKLREGHLTDFSAGYRVHKMTRVAEGETAQVGGRTFIGPVLVATDWEIREISICAIGADSNAKARAKAPAEAKPKQEEDAMNERVRKFLEARGLAKGASEEEAYQFMEQLKLHEEQAEGKERQDRQGDDKPSEGDGRSDPGSDAERVAVAAVRAERERMAEIRAMCRRFDAEELADKLVTQGRSVIEAKDAVLAHLEKRGQAPRPGVRVEMGEDERDKFRAAGTDALLLRGGVRLDKPAPGASELRVLTLRELARECLQRSGHMAKNLGVIEMVGRALTTSDLPYLLEDSARKSLLAGYEAANETWSLWCDTGSVSDFKIHTQVRLSEAGGLDEIPESGEYQYGDLDEERETYQIATYGKLLVISRQTIINDDLSALTKIPAMHGEAAARKVGDIAYVVLTANGNMGDGVALFHAASHANMASSGGAPSITTLGAGVAAMKLQKDVKGLKSLNIKPEYFLGPVTMETPCEQIFRSTLEGTSSKPNQINPYAGEYFERVYDSRLDNDSTTAWYLAGPKGKTVVVYFLDGQQTPWLESQRGWNRDGVEFKVRIDAGANAADWRALYKNGGGS